MSNVNQATTQVVPVIAIDGPSGAGKGTLSSMLAAKLNFNLLDSGALYRILAFWAEQRSLTLEELIAQTDDAKLQSVKMINDTRCHCAKIIIDDNEVTQTIHSEKYGKLASVLARSAELRAKVMLWQRSFARFPGLVADGRDMGTTVFPEAKLKIFLTADLEVRAKRRFLQLQNLHLGVTLENVLEEMRQRDERDRTRSIAPLVPAPSAIILDTSKLSVQKTVDRVLVLAQQAGIL